MNSYIKQALLAIVALTVSVPAMAADTLIIISPHRKSIQQEFIPTFEAHYKKAYGTDVKVEWLDQGGTSDDIRFIRAKFAANPKTSGVDIFWGGGTSTFLELAEDKILAKYELPAELKKQVPEKAAGVPLYDDSMSWYASAMSSFGIFYNKKVLQLDKLPEPRSWKDLAKPVYLNHLTLADPRRSGSASAMNTIVLQSMGWEKGWQLLTEIAGNTNRFTHSSSDPIKAVVSGDAAVAMAIDFYALSKIGDLGPENLGFVLPAGQTVLDPDPVAILKGAPNRKVAERFVQYVLSAEAQKFLVLPKGAKGGPQFAALGRMAINTETYDMTEGKRTSDFNPFKQKAFLKLDIEKASKMRRVFNDLLGAVLIDTHKDLEKAWKAVVKRGMKPKDVAAFGKVPITESEALQLAAKWEDDVFRNKTINEWVKFARNKYQSLAQAPAH